MAVHRSITTNSNHDGSRVETTTTFGEVELVQSCLAGNELAVHSFVERFQGMIFGLCLRMLGHRQDAEDVSQDALARIFRNLHRWDQVRPLKPWLLTITANRCRTALERRRRLARQVDVPTEVSAPLEPTTDLAEELELALGTLREQYRSCFEMFYFQEMSCAEIGEVLGCPQGTVKTWLHRARHDIADQLRRRDIAPEGPS